MSPHNTMSDELDFKNGSVLLEQEHAALTKRPRWTTGVKSIDAHFKNLLVSGQVIGVAKVPGQGATTSLSTHIISTSLLELAKVDAPTSNDPNPTVFIITPPTTQTTLAIATHLSQRLAPTPSKTFSDPTALLSQVQLLQYLSLGGLIESVGDVSAALFNSSTPSPSILLIQGLSAASSEALRRHGATHTAAVTANLMRTLTHLSQTYSHLLILVELDIDLQKSGGTSSAATEALQCAFTSARGEVLRLAPSGGGGSGGPGAGNSAVAVSSALEAGLGVVIAVYDGFGKTVEHDRREAKKAMELKAPHRGTTSIVEVVKDRGGGGFGRWCVWVSDV